MSELEEVCDAMHGLIAAFEVEVSTRRCSTLSLRKLNKARAALATLKGMREGESYSLEEIDVALYASHREWDARNMQSFADIMVKHLRNPRPIPTTEARSCEAAPFGECDYPSCRCFKGGTTEAPHE